MASGRSSTRGSFPQNAAIQQCGAVLTALCHQAVRRGRRARGLAASTGAGQATLAWRRWLSTLTLRARAVAGGQDRVAEQRVELGVQAGAVGDAEVRAELEPSLADRGAELDHHLGLAGEAGQHVLELGQDRRRQRGGVEPEAERARHGRPAGRLLAGLARPPPAWARSARPAGPRCTWSRGPCGRRARGRARSSRARADRAPSSSTLPNTSSSTDASRSSSVANIIGSPFLVRIVLFSTIIPPTVTQSPSRRPGSSDSGQSTRAWSAARTSLSGWAEMNRPIASFSAASNSARSNSMAGIGAWLGVTKPPPSPSPPATPSSRVEGGSAETKSKIEPWPIAASCWAFCPAPWACSSMISMPLRRGAGRAERAALDQRLDRLLVDRPAVDARAEVEQAQERSCPARPGS